jgi:alkaline phosphatase
MSMGLAGTGGVIGMEKLAAQNISAELFSGRIKELLARKKGEVTFADVEPQLKKHFGLDSFTASERGILVSALEKDVRQIKAGLADTTAHDVKRRYVFAQAVRNVLAARAGVGWNTHSHTSLPTLTTAKGCGAEIFGRISDNAEIGVNLKKLIAGRSR